MNSAKNFIAARKLHKGSCISDLTSELAESLFSYLGSLCRNGGSCRVEYDVSLREDGNELVGTLRIYDSTESCITSKKG